MARNIELACLFRHLWSRVAVGGHVYWTMIYQASGVTVGSGVVVEGPLVQRTSDRLEQRVFVEWLAQLCRDSRAPEALARGGLVEGRDEDDRERRVLHRQPFLEVEARHSVQGDVEDQARDLGERG